MVKDTKTGDCLRADHLLEDVMDKLIVRSLLRFCWLAVARLF